MGKRSPQNKPITKRLTKDNHTTATHHHIFGAI